MIGTVVSHYRIVDKLGSGGMGVVYRAEDQRLGRHVAVKFLPEGAGTDPLAVERFEREARTASSLNHPHICTIHDVGEDHGRRFIVMELIDGVTLDRLIPSGPIGIERLIDIGIEVADALDAAHAAGILHRDIKPGNIFITKREQVKVVDFGLAKVMPHRAGAAITTAESSPHFTTSVGIAVGTVAYMSPEHARGEPLDARSDIFSLGVVLYEMSTGIQTFRGQTTAVIFDQILNRVPVAPSSVNPLIPPQLEQIVARSLEKDRRVRYQTARDLQADLERLQHDITTRRVRAASASAHEAAISVGQSWAARGQSGNVETLMVSGSAFSVPPKPVVTPWSGSSANVGPDSEDVDRERLKASAEELSASAAARLPVSSSAARSVPVEPHVTGEAVVVGRDAVDPYAATVIQPSPDATVIALPAIPSAAATPGVAPAVPTRAAVPRAPRRVAGSSVAPLAAVGLVVIVGMAAAGWWLLHRPELPVGAGDSPAVSPGAPRAAAPTPAPSQPGPAPAVALAPASTTTATPQKPIAAPIAPAAQVTSTPASTTTPATRRPSTTNAAARAAEAANALAGARAIAAAGNDEQTLSALEHVSVAYAGTPSGTEALALTAETQQRRNQLEAAINAWVAYSGRGGDAERGGEGLLRTADAAARLKTRPSDEVARRALFELLTRFPTGGRAVRALQMKMALEDRLKLKEQDDQLRGTVPSSLITLRTVAAQTGLAPVAEFALWRLGTEYKDRKLHALAAQTFADLGTRFPNTRYDAWFTAGEIYERQLHDAAHAREAYLKVPPASPRYDDAQRRARR